MDKNALPINNRHQACLREVSRLDIADIQTWFTNKQAVESWAGPKIAYPAQGNVFYQQLMAGNYYSYSLIGDSPQRVPNTLIGFGQFQLHPPFVHLARLAINPCFRGKGFASILLDRLISKAKASAEITQASLFVYASNRVAYKAYINKGFTNTTLPKGVKGIEGCYFMTLQLPLK